MDRPGPNVRLVVRKDSDYTSGILHGFRHNLVSFRLSEEEGLMSVPGSTVSQTNHPFHGRHPVRRTSWEGIPLSG